MDVVPHALWEFAGLAIPSVYMPKYLICSHSNNLSSPARNKSQKWLFGSGKNILRLIWRLEGSSSQTVNCKTLKFVWNIPNMASL